MGFKKKEGCGAEDDFTERLATSFFGDLSFQTKKIKWILQAWKPVHPDFRLEPVVRASGLNWAPKQIGKCWRSF